MLPQRGDILSLAMTSQALYRVVAEQLWAASPAAAWNDHGRVSLPTTAALGR